MREEARQTAAPEADRPAIGQKTWQAENPDVLLGADLCLPLELPFPPAHELRRSV
jgi:hypothetical protein